MEYNHHMVKKVRKSIVVIAGVALAGLANILGVFVGLRQKDNSILIPSAQADVADYNTVNYTAYSDGCGCGGCSGSGASY